MVKTRNEPVVLKRRHGFSASPAKQRPKVRRAAKECSADDQTEFENRKHSIVSRQTVRKSPCEGTRGCVKAGSRALPGRRDMCPQIGGIPADAPDAVATRWSWLGRDRDGARNALPWRLFHWSATRRDLGARSLESFFPAGPPARAGERDIRQDRGRGSPRALEARAGVGQ